MHVTLVPFIKAAGELKTKPTQQSIAKLREIGIQPQVLICRTEMPLDLDVRQKLSMFCNVPLEAVIEAGDVDHTIYEAPLNLDRATKHDRATGRRGAMRIDFQRQVQTLEQDIQIRVHGHRGTSGLSQVGEA